MYAPNAPEPRPSNTDDYTTDDLLAVVATHPDAQAIMAGAFLDYARWITNWSPPEFEETRTVRKPPGAPRRGTEEWRRWVRHKETLR
ncbi:MAG: hypothetical protein K2Y33_13100 [Mycolicibacterium frederiksbergense]|nr:hypothetical protein [Mycolicibacterium frederiksbergense]